MIEVSPPESNVTADISEALAAVLALRLQADRLERRTVRRALSDGWSWADIADALGVSRQAAHKRLSPLMRLEGKEADDA